MHGWIIIDKPLGPGSTQMVSAVKRALRIGGYGKYKVGHGGTLDPLASGVLPIALGEATKLSGHMLDADKGYVFTIGFGIETDTLDAEGKAVATSDVRPTLAEVEAVLARFTGPLDQVPPAYSAIKIDGERAYDRARAGEVFEIQTRAVTVYSLVVVEAAPPSSSSRMRGSITPRPQEVQASEDMDSRLQPVAAVYPERLPCRQSKGGNDGEGVEGGELSAITLSCSVSKGTYIRSLARDIARALGTVGHVTMLRRTKAGPFTLDAAISLDKLDEFAKAHRLEKALLPMTAGLDDIPALSVTPDQARALREGRRLIGIAAPTGLNLAIEGDVPVALVEAEANVSGCEIRVVRGFNLMSKEDA